jgi:hypothetical protein
MKNTILFLFAILLSIGAKAQDVTTTPQEESIYKKLEKNALDADKIFLIKKAIVITNADGDFFWPIYREYNSKLEELNNRSIALYSDYIEKKDDIVFSQAMDLLEEMMAIDQDLLKLEKKYYKKMVNGMNPVKVVAYFNLEREVQLKIRLEMIKEFSK